MNRDRVTIKVKLLHPDAKLPTRARKGDVAFDLYSVTEYILKPGKRFAVPIGISIEIPEGFEGEVRPRSGLALQYGVTVLNSPGTIDSSYRGELRIILINLGNEPFHIRKGMRICQLAIRRVPDVEMLAAETLSETERGTQGFGSTGI